VTAAAQVGPVPGQNVSFVCTPFVQLAARQRAVPATKPSVGHVELEPVHFSATSHAPAICRHTVPALPALWVHVPPWHVSVVQVWPSSVHSVPSVCLPSAHVVDDPLQKSVASHSPFWERHCVFAGSGEQVPSLPATLHAWQSVLPPAHVVLQQ
jgi:hypothetical protein